MNINSNDLEDTLAQALATIKEKMGESYSIEKVNAPDGISYQCACFAMICHHCGERYIEFFPNARQENLFIGMFHAFIYMGIPENVLTDNM